MKAIILLIAFTFFLLSAQTASAVSINILQSPSIIGSDIFNLEVSISGATDGQNYLRLDLYKDGTSNYFGETFNGSSWYSGTDGKQYFPITISSSSAHANFQAKIGSPTSSDYPGPGDYKLKIRRYTQSGSTSSSDSQTPVTITINYSSPTPTFTPAPTPVPSLTFTPTTTPSPLPTPSKTSTPKPTSLTPSSTEPHQDSNSQATNNSVLGSSSSLTLTPTISKVVVAGIMEHSIIGLIFIILGLIFMFCCGIVVFWSYRKSKVGAGV